MIFQALAPMVLPAIAGSATTFGLSKLFGGGGGGSSGGGGGYGSIEFDPFELAGKFRDEFTEDLYMPKEDFGALTDFFSQNVNTNPMFDRTAAISTLSSYSDPNQFMLNQDVQDLMTGTVDKKDAKNLIADEFRLASKGGTATQAFVDDTYKSLADTGQLGSPSSIAGGTSRQIASLFPEYRSKSAEEYAQMAKYGPGKVDSKSGALLFKKPDILKQRGVFA